MTDRSERREEIKLALEYVKIAVSLLGLISIVFALKQWDLATEAANQAATAARLTVYQRMTTEWRDHLKTFVEKPDLRPYFETGKQLPPNDPIIQEKVFAVADIRLDVADAILTYGAEQKFPTIEGWKNTIANAFRTSPVLCARFEEVRTSFTPSQILPIATKACRKL